MGSLLLERSSSATSQSDGWTMALDTVPFLPTQSSLGAGEQGGGDRKGNLDGIVGKSGPIDCGFLGRWSKPEKVEITSFLLQGARAESFLLSIPFLFRKTQPPFTSIFLCSAARPEPPAGRCISCSISETQQLQTFCLSLSW